jgi:NitT/TauT family transport system permease protein
VWLLVSASGAVSPLILPSPLAVGRGIRDLLASAPGLWPDIGWTLYRTTVALVLASLVGIPAGLLMGLLPRVYSALEFLVDFFRSIPPIALFPLFLVALGVGEGSRIAAAVYGCALILTVNGIYGVVNAPRIRRDVGLMSGLSKVSIFLKIVVPDALPQICVGLRTSLSLALVLTIVMEMLIGASDGLGKRIYDFHLLLESDHLFASILVTGAMGYCLNKGFAMIERRFVHWADK